MKNGMSVTPHAQRRICGVLLNQAARIRPRPNGVAVDRDEERLGAELAAVAEEALPVEAAVLGDRVGRPVVDLVDGLQPDRVRAEADQPLRREVPPHLDVRGADGDQPDRQAGIATGCCGTSEPAGRAAGSGRDR